MKWHIARMHEDMKERKLKCKVIGCGKSFAQKRELITHDKTHTGERPYKCSSCDSTFTKSVHGNRHTNIHTEGIPHVCMLCGKGFIQRSNMVIHTAKGGVGQYCNIYLYI